jgi:hypothetical protein
MLLSKKKTSSLSVRKLTRRSGMQVRARQAPEARRRRLAMHVLPPRPYSSSAWSHGEGQGRRCRWLPTRSWGGERQAAKRCGSIGRLWVVMHRGGEGRRRTTTHHGAEEAIQVRATVVASRGAGSAPLSRCVVLPRGCRILLAACLLRPHRRSRLPECRAAGRRGEDGRCRTERPCRVVRRRRGAPGPPRSEEVRGGHHGRRACRAEGEDAARQRGGDCVVVSLWGKTGPPRPPCRGRRVTLLAYCAG